MAVGSTDNIDPSKAIGPTIILWEGNPLLVGETSSQGGTDFAIAAASKDCCCERLDYYLLIEVGQCCSKWNPLSGGTPDAPSKIETVVLFHDGRTQKAIFLYERFIPGVVQGTGRLVYKAKDKIDSCERCYPPTVVIPGEDCETTDEVVVTSQPASYPWSPIAEYVGTSHNEIYDPSGEWDLLTRKLVGLMPLSGTSGENYFDAFSLSLEEIEAVTGFSILGSYDDFQRLPGKYLTAAMAVIDRAVEAVAAHVEAIDEQRSAWVNFNRYEFIRLYRYYIEGKREPNPNAVGDRFCIYEEEESTQQAESCNDGNGWSIEDNAQGPFQDWQTPEGCPALAAGFETACGFGIQVSFTIEDPGCCGDWWSDFPIHELIPSGWDPVLVIETEGNCDSRIQRLGVNGDWFGDVVGAWLCCQNDTPWTAVVKLGQFSQDDELLRVQDFYTVSQQNDDGAIKITPRIPVYIGVLLVNCDGIGLSQSDICGNKLPTLTAKVGDVAIQLSYDPSIVGFSGSGYIDCDGQNIPTVGFLWTGGDWEDPWETPPSSTNDGVCSRTGIQYEVDAVLKHVSYTLVLEVDFNYVSQDCVHPMYSIQGQVSLTGFSSLSSDPAMPFYGYVGSGVQRQTFQNICDINPSCDIDFISSSQNVDSDNHHRVRFFDWNASSGGDSQYVKYTWDPATRTLTATWRIVCQDNLGLIRIPVPAGCYVSGQYGWMDNGAWVLVERVGTSISGMIPSVASCSPCKGLVRSDWPSTMPNETTTINLKNLTGPVTVTIANAGNYSLAPITGEVMGNTVTFYSNNAGTGWEFSGRNVVDLTGDDSWSFDGDASVGIPATSGILTCQQTNQGTYELFGSGVLL